MGFELTPMFSLPLIAGNVLYSTKGASVETLAKVIIGALKQKGIKTEQGATNMFQNMCHLCFRKLKYINQSFE